MFTFLVKQSLQNRLFVAAAAAVLIIYGSLTLPRMPIDVFPDLNRPMVTVLTELPGLAPEEVDTLVSFPLETSLIGMPGVNRVRSVSSSGLSIVFVEFEWGTNIYTNRQQVAERLSLVTPGLPEGASPHMGPITSLMGEILLIAIYSEELGPMAVREIADWSIRPRLLAISGVSQVIPIGGELREYRVIPDPVKMFNNDISLNSIHEALDNYSSNAGGGILNQDDREFVIRHISRSTDLENIRNLVVAYRDLTPVLLRQVAEAEFSPRPPRGDAGFMVNEAVIIAVQKQPRADSVTVTRMWRILLIKFRQPYPMGSMSVFYFDKPTL
jgi:heavy-metal exporter, HME family